MTQKYSSTCSGVKIDKTKAGAFLREICARAKATLPAPPLTSVYGIVISSDGSGRKIVIGMLGQATVEEIVLSLSQARDDMLRLLAEQGIPPAMTH